MPIITPFIPSIAALASVIATATTLAPPPTSAEFEPSAEAAAPSDPAARAAYEASAAAVAALRSVEFRLGSTDEAKDAHLWRVFAAAGEKSHGKTRIEYEDGSVFVSDGTRAMLTRPDKKTFRELDPDTEALRVAIGTPPDWWLLSMRSLGAAGEHRNAAGESFESIVDPKNAAPTIVDGVPCDLVRRTVRGVASAEVDGKLLEVPMVFDETIAIGRTDHLPRRFDQRSGAARERPDLVPPNFSFVAIVAIDPHLAPGFDQSKFAVPTRAELEGRGFKAWTRPAPKAPSPLPPIAVGDLAPDFALKDLDGREVRLSALRGKVLVVDFWATWCGPCRAAMPFLDELHREYQAKAETKDSVVFLALNTGESDVENARRYFRDKGYGMTCLLEADAAQLAYRVSGLPSLFVIAPDGRVVFTDYGFGAEGYSKRLRDQIDAARRQ